MPVQRACTKCTMSCYVQFDCARMNVGTSICGQDVHTRRIHRTTALSLSFSPLFTIGAVHAMLYICIVRRWSFTACVCVCVSPGCGWKPPNTKIAATIEWALQSAHARAGDWTGRGEKRDVRALAACTHGADIGNKFSMCGNIGFADRVGNNFTYVYLITFPVNQPNYAQPFVVPWPIGKRQMNGDGRHAGTNAHTHTHTRRCVFCTEPIAHSKFAQFAIEIELESIRALFSSHFLVGPINGMPYFVCRRQRARARAWWEIALMRYFENHLNANCRFHRWWYTRSVVDHSRWLNDWSPAANGIFCNL